VRGTGRERGRNVGTLGQDPGRGTKDERKIYLEYSKKTKQLGQTPMKFIDFQQKTISAGSPTMSSAVVQKMNDASADAVKRDASSFAAGGGGQTIITDASKKSVVNNAMGSSGRWDIRNNKFGSLNAVVY
jgi:hypothetical protein